MAISNGVGVLTIKYRVAARAKAPAEKQEDYLKRPYRAIVEGRNTVSLDAFASRVQIRTGTTKQEIKSSLDAIIDDLIDLLANGDTIDLGIGKLAPSITGSVLASRQLDTQNAILLAFTPAKGIKVIKAEATTNVDTLQPPNIVAWVDETTHDHNRLKMTNPVLLTGHRLSFTAGAADEGVFASIGGVVTKLNVISMGDTMLVAQFPEGFAGAAGVYDITVASRGGNTADLLASPLTSNVKHVTAYKE